MPPNVIELAIPFFLLAIVVELIVTVVLKKNYYRLNDAISDLSCGIVSQLVGLFIKFFTVGIYAYVEMNHSIQHYTPIPPFAEGAPFASWVNFGSWVFAFVAVDFCYYWLHRFSHTTNILWAGHVVHHSSEDYNLTVALRQSALHGIFSWVFYIPLALIGVPWEMFTVSYGINLIYQFWIHTRLIGKMGAFEYIFNSPSLHRVHHGVNPQYIDKNHAGVFIIWDRMFGTYEPEVEEPVYGITIPLHSFNPVYANTHVFQEIIHNIKQARSIKDIFNFLFEKPGWKPPYLGESFVPPPVSAETFIKYDPPVSNSLKWYAGFQFLLTLGVSFAALIDHTMPDLHKGIITAIVIFSLVTLGEMLENKHWAFHVEFAKQLFIAGVGLVLLLYFKIMLAGAICLALAIIFMIWHWRKHLNFVKA